MRAYIHYVCDYPESVTFSYASDNAAKLVTGSDVRDMFNYQDLWAEKYLPGYCTDQPLINEGGTCCDTYDNCIANLSGPYAVPAEKLLLLAILLGTASAACSGDGGGEQQPPPICGNGIVETSRSCSSFRGARCGQAALRAGRGIDRLRPRRDALLSHEIRPQQPLDNETPMEFARSSTELTPVAV
jgi:hypothetical protein